jgi:hypothetical protein
LPSTLVVGVAGRALASLRCHLGGDAGILHRVWPSRPERLIRIMSGCIGHLLRGGWPLVVCESRSRKTDTLVPLLIGEHLVNTDSSKVYVRRWVVSKTTAGCSAIGIPEAAMTRPPLRCIINDRDF